LRVDKFDIPDGRVVVIGPDGEPRRSGKDARHYMLPDEWLESMQGEKPILVRQISGRGPAPTPQRERAMISFMISLAPP